MQLLAGCAGFQCKWVCHTDNFFVCLGRFFGFVLFVWVVFFYFVGGFVCFLLLLLVRFLGGFFRGWFFFIIFKLFVCLLAFRCLGFFSLAMKKSYY